MRQERTITQRMASSRAARLVAAVAAALTLTFTATATAQDVGVQDPIGYCTPSNEVFDPLDTKRDAFPRAAVHIFEDSGHWPFVDNEHHGR